MNVVAHSRPYAGVAHDELQGRVVLPPLDPERAEVGAEVVDAYSLSDPRLLEDQLEVAPRQVLAPHDASGGAWEDESLIV